METSVDQNFRAVDGDTHHNNSKLINQAHRHYVFSYLFLTPVLKIVARTWCKNYLVCYTTLILFE